MKKLSAVHAMTGYIQGHYFEALTLDDIASAGLVCRSRCCELFKEYIGKTPIDHLNEYRISKSIDLLNETDMSVAEIAEKCGFNSSSYFAEVFRKTLGSSPKEFRSKQNNLS
ncbi:MAG: helix-turn-helix transcriptional regulator [Oscillospiraceae bacterium]